MKQETLKISNLLDEGDVQGAFILAEQLYHENPSSLRCLEDYVNVMLHNLNPSEDYLRFAEKIEHVILSSSFKIDKNLSLLFMLDTLYQRTGDLKKRQSISKKINLIEGENPLSTVTDLSSNMQDVKPNRIYFSSQLLELIKFLQDKHYQNNKDLKKIYVMIKGGMIEEGYYLLKKFSYTLDTWMEQFILAELALIDNKYSLAKSKYLSILESNDFTDKWMVWNRLGDVYLCKGSNDRALKSYLKAYDLNPNDIDTNLDIVRTYILKGDIKKAKRLYNKASSQFGKSKTQPIKKYFTRRKLIKDDKVVNGLAYFQTSDDTASGSILEIGFSINNRNDGKIDYIGNIGFSMINSIKSAKIVVSKYLEKKNNKSITINIPHMIIHKDGPSAGTAIAVGLLATILSKEIPRNVAFTGEISTCGKIYPVGGIKQKINTAYINGIDNVYIPKQNFIDLSTLSSRVKSKVNISLVSNFSDIPVSLWN